MQGVVLNRYKQSETSLILKIFTGDKGLISCYVRGALKRKAIPEIGDVLEFTPQRRGAEGLFSLYQFDVVQKNHFPAFLEIQTFRDIIFELLVFTLPEEHEEAELFEVTCKALTYLEHNKESIDHGFFALWLWLYRYTNLLGLDHDFFTCSSCGKDEIVTRFLPQGQGIVCGSCSPKTYAYPSLLVLLLTGNSSIDSLNSISLRERLLFTRSLVEYIQENLGSQRKLHSLEFLQTLV